MSSQYERWDQVYRKYPPEALPWELGRPRKVLVDLVESGKVKPGKALDICCGMGTNALYMAEKGFQVQGIDISPKATEYAREKAEKAGAEISFSVENAVYLPFADEQFDFVFDMGCFHHISVEERERFLRGVHRLLKPGSKYLVVCFSYRNGPAWNHFTKEQLIGYFSPQFKIEQTEHFSSVEGDGAVRFFWSVLMEKGWHIH